MSDSTLALRRQPRDSLATKIIFFVFLSTFITALVVSWISVHSTYAFLRHHLDVSYPRLAHTAAEWMDGRTARAEREAAELAASPVLADLLAGAPNARGPAEQALATACGPESPFSELVVRDTHGAVRARTPSEPMQAVPPADPEDAGGGRIREIGGRFVLSLPIATGAAETAGTLQAVLASDAIAAGLVRARGADDTNLYLADASGRILLGTDRESARPFETLPASLLAPGAQPLAREFHAADGRRGIAAVEPLALPGWSVVVAEPIEVAFAPIFSVVTRVFVIDLAVILAFSFLAYEITAKIVRPLEALSEGARRISQGELGVEIPEADTRDEIGLLTRTFNDMARRLRRNRDELELHHEQLRERNDELQRANEVLEQLSITDGLTKLHNHRYFQETLTREIKRVSRTGEPLSMLLIDIDDFKALNDRYGHADGDAVLSRIARVLNESVRESDVLARYGGEEFVVLATGTDLDGAVFLAEKVRTAVAESRFELPAGEAPVRVTISIGVAPFAGDRRRFFHAADRALYRAKAAGKNCVVTADASDWA